MTAPRFWATSEVTHSLTVNCAERVQHNSPAHPQVATIWICQLWQFAQIFNLFMGARRYTVDMGYNSRDVQSIKELCHSVLIELEEHGGPDATALIRRYARVDPAVTLASFDRRTQAAKDKQFAEEGQVGWKPFLLF